MQSLSKVGDEHSQPHTAVGNFVIAGIIASMKAVRRLAISYGGDAGSVNVDFLLSLSGQGVMDISIDTNSNCGTKSSSWLRAEDIVAFVLAGATDGQHRKIEFNYGVVNANRLLKLLLEVCTSRGYATAAAFSRLRYNFPF